ncbi:MAG: alpha/beta hydrolase [Bdellovibrionales bacterium]|nr:alpha/beta hydrolase [Bdellovibrionales bacterium]
MTAETSPDSDLLSLTCCAPEGDHSRSALLVIKDLTGKNKSVCSVFGRLNSDFKTYVLESPLPSVDEVAEYSDTLSQTLLNSGVRRATVFGIGAGATVAQSLAIIAPKVVRRLVLLDATPRLAPGFLCKTVDRIERFLPLGLPLRRLRAHYDSRPMLHRIHCPTLLLLSKQAGQYEQQQAQYIRSKIPNSWFKRISNIYNEDRTEFSEELQELLTTFLQVPVKRPQKIKTETSASSHKVRNHA